jgi:sugar phosphate isomerase/epimerase
MANTVLGVGYSLPPEDDFALQKLGPRLDEAEAFGADFVELPLHGMDLIAGGRILTSRVKTVKAALAGRPLRYTAHGPLAIDLMDIPERLPRHQDVLKASLEVAAELGALHYVLHTGVYAVERSPRAEDLYGQQRDILHTFGDLAASLGPIIVVENLYSGPAFVTALPSRLAKEIAAVAHSHVWACLDFSHGYINTTARGANFAAEAAALAPFAKHLHIHDSFGRPAEQRIPRRSESLAFGEGDLHLPVGLGDIPWDALMDRLDFPGGVVFNIELRPPYWSALGETLARTRALAARARTAGS